LSKKHKRGRNFENPRGVLAYERNRTVFYESMSQCMQAYDIRSTSILERLIENGWSWHDGYTTFDWATEDPPNRYPLPTEKKR